MSRARKTIEVEVSDTSDFYFGQKLYMVDLKKYNGHKVFREKCPVCGDTKEIELKGYKFKCPLCEGSRADSSATSIDLRDYVVTEFIINRFEITGSSYKNAYSGEGLLNERNLPNVKWYGFARWGNGYSDVTSRQFSEYDVREVDPDKVDIKRAASGHCFFTKSEAKRFCERLHERQKELLEKFNAKHGTDHAYPFEY